MKKLILFLILLIPINVFAVSLDDLNSSNYLIYDITDDQILVQKNSDEIRTVASLTKMLSIITTIENVDNLDEEITITNEMLSSVPWDAYKIGLKVGETFTIKELLLATNMKSAADAINPVAYKVGGSISGFVNLMEIEKNKIGLDNSTFTNAIGMDTGGNKSNASDINKLLLYCLKNKTFKEIYTTNKYILNNGIDISNSLDNLNSRFDKSVKIYGYKTGYTASAGSCISSYFVTNGHEYTIVTLNAHATEDDKYPNYSDLLRIVKFLNDTYNMQVLVDKDKAVKTLNVKDASIDEYNIYLNEDVVKYLKNDYDKSLINIVYDGINELSDKNKLGDKLGNIKVYYDNELLYEKDIYLNISIKHTIPQLIRKYKIMYILFFMFCLILFIKMFIKKPCKK